MMKDDNAINILNTLNKMGLSDSTVRYYFSNIIGILRIFGRVPREGELDEFIQDFAPSTRWKYLRLYRVLKSNGIQITIHTPNRSKKKVKEEYEFTEEELALIHETLIKVAAFFGVKIRDRHFSVKHGIRSLLRDLVNLLDSGGVGIMSTLEFLVYVNETGKCICGGEFEKVDEDTWICNKCKLTL